MAQSDQLPTSGVFCNFYDIDSITGEFQGGDLIVVGGVPGIGKSTFALNIVRNASEHFRVAFFSLSTPKEQLITKLLSLESGIECSNLLVGKVFDYQQEQLTQAVETLERSQLIIDDSSHLTTVDICNSVRNTEINNKKIEMLVIDSIDLVEASESFIDKDEEVYSVIKDEEVYSIIRRLKIFAREFKIPVMVLSSVRSEVVNRINKRPFLSDLPGRIDEIANLVFFLHRDATEIDLMEVIVAKNQNGPTGVIKLFFQPQFCRLRNIVH
jgi:replicative DNA helicase